MNGKVEISPGEIDGNLDGILISPQPPGVLGDRMDHVVKNVAAEVRPGRGLVTQDLVRVPDQLKNREIVTLTNAVRKQ